MDVLTVGRFPSLRGKRKCLLAALVLLFSLSPWTALAADGLRLGEQEIKAGLLYNFLKYTQWPESSFANTPSITVCVFGDDPFGGKLRPMEGRTVHQRPIDLRQLRDVDEVEGCHLLYVSAGEKQRWPQLRRVLSNRNILTVSDFFKFADSGGMIEFERRDNRISAVLNLSVLRAAGLNVEDRMLRLVTVMDSPPGRKP